MTNHNLFANELITPGTRVIHKEYGIGTITNKTQDKIYVSFSDRHLIFPFPDSFTKGYLSINDMDIGALASDNASHIAASTTKVLVSDNFANWLDKYFDQFPTRWETEKYIWKAVQTFQDHWNPDASNFSQMLEEATVDADYLLNHNLFYPRAMIVDLAQDNPAYVRSMFDSLFDESIDVAIRAEQFSNAADQIRNEYQGKFYGRNYQTMNAVSTYLWLMYPNKYYFYKYTVAQKVSSETGISYKSGRIPEVQKMINQFALMDEVSATLRKDDRSRKLLNPRLNQSLYSDYHLHCMAMDFAFFIRSCYENSKE